MRHGTSRGVIALLTSLSIACGGRGCGSPESQASAIDPPATASTVNGPSRADQRLHERISNALLGGPGQTREQVARRYGAVLEALRDTRSSMTRHTFDPAAIVSAVGSDPQALFAWVRDNTRAVPYRGVLRGSIGVLMDRVGNSLDRSLLLAELLRRAGHTTRIAQGTLSVERARELVKNAKLPGGTGVLASGEFQIAAANQIAQKTGADPAALRALVTEWRDSTANQERAAIERAEAQTRVLNELLAETLSRAPEAADELAAAVTDHAWVQLKNGSEWSDLDPILMPDGPGTSATAPGRTFNVSEIPAEMYHRVRIRLQIERWQGSTLDTVSVLDHELRTADVAGVPIKLLQTPTGVPDAWTRPPAPGADAAQVAGFLTTQKEWVVTLVVGSKRTAQSQFTLSGEIRSGGSGGTLRPPVSGGFFDALGGGEEPAAGQLAAQFLEYEISVPGAQPRVERRQLFDWVDPAARSAGATMTREAIRVPPDAALAAVRETALMVLGGQVSDEFVEHAMLGHLTDRASLVAAALKDPAAGADAVSRMLRRSDARLEPRLLELALGRVVLNDQERQTFVARPNVLTLHRGIAAGADGELKGWEAYDIVTNDVEAIPGSAAPRLARLRQGIADANAEASLAGSGSDVPGISEIMSAGRMSPDQWVVVTRAADVPADLPLGADARARLASALERGLVAVLPSRPADLSASVIGWWEVDPRTGRTMAIDSRGWGGQALVEVKVTDMIAYLMEMVLGSLCFINTIKGMAGNSLGGNVCGFASCTASLVLIHLSFFKVAVHALVGPSLGLGFGGCALLFPAPPGK